MIRYFRRRAARRALEAAKVRVVARGLESAYIGSALIREAERIQASPSLEAVLSIRNQLDQRNAITYRLLNTSARISRRLERPRS